MTRAFRSRVTVVLALGLMAVSTQVDAAGQNRAGTAAATELLIPIGAREMALGGASVASTAGLAAMYWNPAGLDRAASDASMMVSTMSYLADIRVNYIAAAAKFGRIGSMGFDLKALSVGDIPITTERQPDGTGGSFSPTMLTLGLHYSNHLTDRITVGGTTHYVINRIERVDATALSFSAGLQYANLADIAGLDLGVAVKHIGSRMQFDGPALLNRGQLDDLRRPPGDYKVESSSADLPSIFEIGLGYSYMPGMGEVNLSSVFRHNNYANDQVRSGVEYVVNDFFTLRAGFDYATGADDGEYLYGTSFGFGLNTSIGNLENLQLDYAYSSVDYFDALNTFTFQVGF